MNESTRKACMAAGVGAMAATTVLVTVYEGRVLLANEHGQDRAHRGRAGAGARAVAAPRGAAANWQRAGRCRLPRTLSRARSTRRRPAADARRGAARRAGTSCAHGSRDGRPVAQARSDAATALLQPVQGGAPALAKECKLKWDMPIVGIDPRPERQARRAVGLSDQERSRSIACAAEYNARMVRKDAQLLRRGHRRQKRRRDAGTRRHGEEIPPRSPEDAGSRSPSSTSRTNAPA